MNVLRLHPEGGGETIAIEHSMVRLGRDASADVQLKDASVSRQHAEIMLRDDDWVIVDQNSGNGLRIDGRRAEQAVLLPGQTLEIGNLKFKVEIDRGDDGKTMMLDRTPLARGGDDDKTVLGTAPTTRSLAPPAPSTGNRGLIFASVALVLGFIGVGYVGFTLLSNQAKPAPRVMILPRPVPTPSPTPEATPTPEPTPTPTPVPLPTGSLLISSDVDAKVTIDGRIVTRLKASGAKRFQVAPGEHIVRFSWEGQESEVVTRVRANEQKVVRRLDEDAAAVAPAAPTPR